VRTVSPAEVAGTTGKTTPGAASDAYRTRLSRSCYGIGFFPRSHPEPCHQTLNRFVLEMTRNNATSNRLRLAQCERTRKNVLVKNDVRIGQADARLTGQARHYCG
jgi:hypothetical protein